MVLEKLQEILSELSLAVRDAEKFDAGNASAGRRVRSSAMAAGTLSWNSCGGLRSEVMSELHERKGS